MFKTYRYTFNGKITAESYINSKYNVKEWDTFEKAIAYARRYAIGSKFVACEVFNDSGKMIFRIDYEGKEHFTKEKTTAQKVSEKQTDQVEPLVAENHNDELPMYKIRLVRENTPAMYCNIALNTPERVAMVLLNVLADVDRECFVMIGLDTKNKVIGANIVSQGTLNASLVHPREVFKAAILMNAASIVIGHNHPSGDAKPSSEDIKITKRLVKAGEILDIPVIDHVVIGDGTADYVSFKEDELI